MARVLTFHNLIEYRKYLGTIYQLAMEADTVEQFLKEIKYSITKDRHEEARIGLNIVETGVNHGIKEVDKRFHLHLHQGGGLSEGLFRTAGVSPVREADRQKWLASRVKEYEKHFGAKAK